VDTLRAQTWIDSLVQLLAALEELHKGLLMGCQDMFGGYQNHGQRTIAWVNNESHFGDRELGSITLQPHNCLPNGFFGDKDWT